MDGAVFFRKADDGGGREQTLVRVIETQQGLEAGRLAGCEVLNRLEVGFEPVFGKRLRDIPLQLRMFARPIHDRTVEDLGTILACSLAGIHRHVGILQKLGGAGSVQGINRHADAGAEADAVAGNLERCVQYGADAFAELERALFHLVAGQQDGEFVAAEPRRAVQRRQQRFELQRELLENRITCRMAKIVVDGLEAIEIDEQAGQFAAVPVRFADLQVEDRLETLTVEEAGQVVGNGLLAVAFFRLAQFGHIRHDAEAGALMQGIAGIERLFEDKRIHHAAIHAMKADGNAGMRDIW
ncbi:hypothetical protein D3C80_975040 [compost metagenome]